MKEKLTIAFWFILTSLLIMWTAYQSWTWFISNGQPFTVSHWTKVQPVEEPKIDTVIVGKEQVVTQPAVVKAVTTKPVVESTATVLKCSTEDWNFYNQNIKEYQELFEAKPWLETETDAGLRMQQLITMRDNVCL